MKANVERKESEGKTIARRTAAVAMFGAVALCAAPPSTWAQCAFQQTAKLWAQDGSAGDTLGYSAAASGDVAIVGRVREENVGVDQGAAYVFRRTASGWQQQVLYGEQDGDEFGHAVAVHGNVAVVGAWMADPAGDRSGAAYVYRYHDDTSAWVLEESWSGAHSGAHFGAAVAVYGDVVVVGAQLEDGNGAAHLYRYDDSLTEWRYEQKLQAYDGAGNDRFGRFLALWENTVFVTALWDDDRGNDSGSTYVFQYRPELESWEFEQKLLADDGQAEDQFGIVSLCGDAAVIGATWHHQGDYAGAAYVFQRDAELGWVQQDKLLGEPASGEEMFGIRTSIHGDAILVGAPGHVDQGVSTGAAYVFRRNGPEWDLECKLLADDGAGGDAFGSAVALSADYAVVAASGDDDLGEDSGAAYVFDTVTEPLSVGIDIKPGSYPNAINLGSHGVVPVAILSSAIFDAIQVDAETVFLSGAGVAVRGRGSNLLVHEQDVDGDGLLDLVVQVETENLDPDQFQDGFAILTGTTFGGEAFIGLDEITIVP